MTNKHLASGIVAQYKHRVAMSVPSVTSVNAIARRWQVVPDEAVENPDAQIGLSEAQQEMPEIQLDEFIEEQLELVKSMGLQNYVQFASGELSE